jgi:hypothetical protein
MNTATCHASPIGTLQESAITPTRTASLSMTSRRTKKLATNAPRRQRPRGKGKADKEKDSKDSSDMDKDPAPKPAEKAEGGAGTGNPYKSTKKGAFHTFLGPPMAKAQQAAMRSLNATVPKVRQYVRWSEIPVQWSCDDHPEHIPDGYYAMVVNPLIRLKRIHNFLCSMLVFTPFAYCFITIRGTFMHFLELTY